MQAQRVGQSDLLIGRPSQPLNIPNSTNSRLVVSHVHSCNPAGAHQHTTTNQLFVVVFFFCFSGVRWSPSFLGKDRLRLSRLGR